MIPTHVTPSNGPDTRNALTFNSLTLNDPADPVDDTFELNAVVTVPQYDTSVDSDPADDGSLVTPAKRILYVARLDGTIRAPTQARLYDKKKLLALTMDPALLSLNNPTTFGVLPMDFNVPTLDTANYATGLVPSRYYCRPRGVPVPIDSMYQGYACFFSIEMAIYDPRRYLQTTTTKTIVGTSSTTSGNTLADYPSWPTVVVTMTGAGSATYSVDQSGDTPAALVINLSSALSGDTYTIDMQAGTITRVRAGVSTDQTALKVSGDWFQMTVANATLTVANGTNASTAITWRRAFVV